MGLGKTSYKSSKNSSNSSMKSRHRPSQRNAALEGKESREAHPYRLRILESQEGVGSTSAIWLEQKKRPCQKRVEENHQLKIRWKK
ncbi:hypothetical protein MRB53_032830 [Persea americana]|uniref:Uncharacterized protein n=1 Tax=Persea americana TaxID=3435 RepID=A0ACC2KT14_PERAE|nr:hypothetical protein MRB53_032830 [Persea americana]